MPLAMMQSDTSVPMLLALAAQNGREAGLLAERPHGRAAGLGDGRLLQPRGRLRVALHPHANRSHDRIAGF